MVHTRSLLMIHKLIRPLPMVGIPQPEMKEFIVRSVVPRPLPMSRIVGNRMYVILNEPASEFRISTMLSLDE